MLCLDEGRPHNVHDLPAVFGHQGAFVFPVDDVQGTLGTETLIDGNNVLSIQWNTVEDHSKPYQGLFSIYVAEEGLS